MTNRRFDSTYFRRYYGTRPVRTTADVEHLATAVHGMVAWWGGKIRSVLEIGAGPGDWGNWYRRVHPGVRVMSTDASEYACATWGHARRDISDWAPARPFDLVVCTDVLQYLDDRRAARAIRNIALSTRTCLYFDALTRGDARSTVELSSSDLDVHLREGDWYRTRIARHFRGVGAGLWLRKSSNLVLHELERSG